MATAIRASLVNQISELVGSYQIARWICEDVADFAAPEKAVQTALALGCRFVEGEPLQYLLGHWSFRSLDLLCDRRALIPRPETEQLVELVKTHLLTNSNVRNILEIGTGCGAIALALASEVEDLSILASDISHEALGLAQDNSARLPAKSASVELAHSDLFASLDGARRFEVIVSNPPYVPDGSTLEARVVGFEPNIALFAGKDGLEVIGKIIEQSPNWLAGRGSKVFLEIDETHGARVTLLAERSGFAQCTITQDFSGRDRFASLTY